MGGTESTSGDSSLPFPSNINQLTVGTRGDRAEAEQGECRGAAVRRRAGGHGLFGLFGEGKGVSENEWSELGRNKRRRKSSTSSSTLEHQFWRFVCSDRCFLSNGLLSRWLVARSKAQPPRLKPRQLPPFSAGRRVLARLLGGHHQSSNSPAILL